VDGNALGGCLVIEAHFVGNVHTNWISNKGFAALNLLKK
jgi:hypothetical protein